MNPSLATLLYALGIAGLFYLNRDKSAHTSRALWIPVIWFWILGSRAASVWLGGGVAKASADQMMDGSPTDAFVFLVLLVGGLAVLAHRGNRPLSVMAANWPIVLYFLYCLMSVVWSDYPDVAIKRWFKATGDVVMALVVVTVPQPVAALRRLFSRLGFVLLPASVLFIKYYPYLGRNYSEWSGQGYNTGVTTDKNLLGLTTYVLALGALWQILRLWKNPSLPNRSRQLLAQCTLLGFGIWLLSNADSATSTACFALGAIVMLVTDLRRIRGRPAAVHALALTLVLFGGLTELTGADAALMHAMGRNTDLTGRASEIWPLLIPMAPSALVGAGFESFWLGPRLQKVWDAFPNLYVSEAHNGYIEVYLNLGVIGLTLIILLLVHGYRRSVAAFRIDPNSGGLMLAYVFSAVMYSYTEAGFRMLDYAWSFLLLAIIGASRISEPTGETQLDRAPPEPVRWSTDGVQTTSIRADVEVIMRIAGTLPDKDAVMGMGRRPEVFSKRPKSH
jgi:exopolysaccharide production protein ExoQ